MFQFARFPSHALGHGWLCIITAGFLHSDVCGSPIICISPQLFAACHVLRRLPVPRHPPYALLHLTFKCVALPLLINFSKLLFSGFSVEIVYPCFSLDSLSIILETSVSSKNSRFRFVVICFTNLSCDTRYLVFKVHGGLGRTRTSDLTLIRRAL